MDAIQTMADQYKMLGDKSRLTILALLQEEELCVCEIVEVMGMSQPNVSQHMRKLKSTGLVKEKRQGQWIFYSLDLEDKPYIKESLKHVPSMKTEVTYLKEKGLKMNCCN